MSNSFYSVYLFTLEWHGIKREDSRQSKKKGKQAEDLCTLCILKLNGCIIWGIRQIKADWFCPLNRGCIQRVNQLLLIICKILIRVLKLCVKQHMVCYLIKEVFPGYRIHSLSDKNNLWTSENDLIQIKFQTLLWAFYMWLQGRWLFSDCHQKSSLKLLWVCSLWHFFFFSTELVQFMVFQTLNTIR